jgi:hypothetical protein
MDVVFSVSCGPRTYSESIPIDELKKDYLECEHPTGISFQSSIKPLKNITDLELNKITDHYLFGLVECWQQSDYSPFPVLYAHNNKQPFIYNTTYSFTEKDKQGNSSSSSFDDDLNNKSPDQLKAEIKELRAGIRWTDSQQYDDQCWCDFLLLTELLPERPKTPKRLLPANKMLDQCKEFIKCRGDYIYNNIDEVFEGWDVEAPYSQLNKLKRLVERLGHEKGYSDIEVYISGYEGRGYIRDFPFEGCCKQPKITMLYQWNSWTELAELLEKSENISNNLNKQEKIL